MIEYSIPLIIMADYLYDISKQYSLKWYKMDSPFYVDTKEENFCILYSVKMENTSVVKHQRKLTPVIGNILFQENLLSSDFAIYYIDIEKHLIEVLEIKNQIKEYLREEKQVLVLSKNKDLSLYPVELV